MSGERIRKNYYEIQLDSLRESIIGKHRKCKGAGFLERVSTEFQGEFVVKFMIKCKCRKKFDILSRLFLSNIPYKSLINQHIYGKVVTDEISGEKIELRKEVVKPYVKNIKKAVVNPYGLLFLGKNGTGKTFVGLKIAYYTILGGLTAHAIELSDFLKMARKTFDGDREAENFISEITDVDILLIDEIGSESKRSEYVISEFKSLFKKRVSNGKPTILISNYNFDEFKKVYGRSIYSMIRSYCRVLDFSDAVDVRISKDAVERDAFFRKIKRKKK